MFKIIGLLIVFFIQINCAEMAESSALLKTDEIEKSVKQVKVNKRKLIAVTESDLENIRRLIVRLEKIDNYTYHLIGDQLVRITKEDDCIHKKNELKEPKL